MDLIVSGANAVYLNDGGGRFQPHATPSAVTLPPHGLPYRRRLVAGDLNGDALPDLLGEGPNGSLTRWINQGGGVFQVAPGQVPALVVGSLAKGDLDGDGDLDAICSVVGTLVVGSSTLFHPIVALMNDGLGTLTVGSVVAPYGSPIPEVGLADLVQDGDLDFVGCSTATAPVQVWALNVGNGSFGNLVVLGLGNWPNAGIATGDVTGDGRPDLVFDSVSTPLGALGTQVLATGPGATVTPLLLSGATPGPAYSLLLDLDADGRAELLRFLRNGCEIFSFINGVLQPWASRVPMYVDQGGGSLQPSSAVPPPIAANVDGDQDTDLIVPTSQGSQILAVGASGALLALSNPILAPSWFRFVETVDLDGDGALDLVAADTQGLLTWSPPGALVNDGSGHFTWVESVSCPQCVMPAYVWKYFDADGDGDADLYLVNGAGAHQIAINSNGTFTPVGAPVAGAPVGSQVVPLDVDADGDLDLVVGVDYAAGIPPSASLLRNLGGGAFCAGRDPSHVRGVARSRRLRWQWGDRHPLVDRWVDESDAQCRHGNLRPRAAATGAAVCGHGCRR